MKIKICGITTPADALMVAQAGADWIGLNFHPPSPRSVSQDVARTIAQILPPHVEPVGLFVNRSCDDVVTIANRVGLRVLQLHGDEPVEDLDNLREFRVIRAFRIGSPADLDRMHAYADQAADRGHPLAAILVDASVPGQFGGTGATIGGDLLRQIRALRPALPPLILAGGLTPANVAALVVQVEPWMVDVAGGVEASKGRKDQYLTNRFVAAARGTESGILGVDSQKS